MVINIVTNTVMLVFLAVNSWTDIKRRTVIIPLCMAAGIYGLLLHMLCRELSAWHCFFGAVPGVLLCLAAFLVPAHIGWGDGFVITACGLIVGFTQTLMLLTAGLILAGICALALLLSRKYTLRQELPLMPFLFAAQLLLMIG